MVYLFLVYSCEEVGDHLDCGAGDPVHGAVLNAAWVGFAGVVCNTRECGHTVGIICD